MISQDLKTASGIVTSTFDKKDLKPTAVYIDEFQAFGTRGFVGALAQCREAGFGITLAHQSLGDLKVIDPGYAMQVNDNTNTKIFLRVNDPESAETFSDLVGTGKRIETTRQVHLQGEAPMAIMGTEKVVQEYHIHPTEPKHLRTGQAVFKSGHRWGRLLLNGHFKDTSGVRLAEQPQVVNKPSPEPIKGNGINVLPKEMAMNDRS